MDLTERKLKILQAIVSDFIHSAEPVGSRTLSKKYDLGISAATIRNEMSDLEELGYLTHPHTSAGRVPSDKAYRLYVNHLMRKHELLEEQKRAIESQISANLLEFERTVKHAASILSELTNLTSFAITPSQDDNKLKYINLLPVDERSVVLMIVTKSGKINNTTLRLKVPYSLRHLEVLSKVMTYNYKDRSLSDILTLDIIKNFETDIEAMSKLTDNVMPNFMATLENMLNVDLFFDGLTNIFSIPEYNDLEKAKMFMEIINQKRSFTDILINRESGVVVTIGHENREDSMKDCSLITATYCVDGHCVGKLGVIGPTRMRYGEVTSVIEYLTENLNNAFQLKEGEGENE